jgi:hypothetical protein
LANPCIRAAHACASHLFSAVPFCSIAVFHAALIAS